MGEEELPSDLKDMDPDEQQRRIKVRAAEKIAIGMVLVLVFSDPVVDMLGEIGNRIGISGFYISFFLAPMASNASEMVAAFTLAKKRTVKNQTAALSTLEGAAIMNNTFVLGIFYVLVYVKNLAWEFAAETFAIVIIQVAIGGLVLF